MLYDFTLGSLLDRDCTRWGDLWGLVPDLKIGYKTAKPRGTKVELISSVFISNVFAKAHQLIDVAFITSQEIVW